MEKTVLIQSTTTTDNTYLIEGLRRFPGRFSAVCRVDVDSDHALQDLERWASEGCDGIRLRNFQRSPGSDPLAIWRRAEQLGLSASVGGPTDVFATEDFHRLVASVPDLKIVLEHLAGMDEYALGDRRQRAEPPYADADYQQALKLAGYPNTYMKIHGMREICPPPFPCPEIPPFVKMAYDAFGSRRMMWGSDFPPVSLREGYRNALRFTVEQLPFCSEEHLEWIFGRTALSVYKFP